MTSAKEAWERVAECEALAKEAGNARSRSLFAKLRDSWAQIAHDCERIERGEGRNDDAGTDNAGTDNAGNNGAGNNGAGLESKH